MKSFPFEDIPAAFRYMRAGNHIGKIVISNGPDAKIDVPVRRTQTFRYSAQITEATSGSTGVPEASSSARCFLSYRWRPERAMRESGNLHGTIRCQALNRHVPQWLCGRKIAEGIGKPYCSGFAGGACPRRRVRSGRCPTRFRGSGQARCRYHPGSHGTQSKQQQPNRIHLLTVLH